MEDMETNHLSSSLKSPPADILPVDNVEQEKHDKGKVYQDKR